MRKYRLVAKKGEGTFSEVLKAQNVKDGRYHAIKCMKNRFESIDQVNNLREIQALRRLSPHDHVITLEEVLYDQPTGRLALVFELMDANLYELIRGRRHYLNPQLIKSYMWQLMKSLDHMHKKGIFHRDIKPENILIESGTDVGKGLKLADFGSCRGIYSKQPYTEYISTRWYRAPECLLTDGYYGPEMDLWGAGCVMFEITSLYPLFPGSNESDQINRIHKILGTPTQDVLSKLKSKGASHISFDFPEQKGVGLSQLVPHATTDALDLMIRLLKYDGSERITAREAMRHPYLKEMRELDHKRTVEGVSPMSNAATTKSGASSSFNNTGNSSELGNTQKGVQKSQPVALGNEESMSNFPSKPTQGHHHHHNSTNNHPSKTLPTIDGSSNSNNKAANHILSKTGGQATHSPHVINNSNNNNNNSNSNNNSTMNLVSNGASLPPIHSNAAIPQSTKLLPVRGQQQQQQQQQQQYQNIPVTVPYGTINTGLSSNNGSIVLGSTTNSIILGSGSSVVGAATQNKKKKKTRNPNSLSAVAGVGTGNVNTQNAENIMKTYGLQRNHPPVVEAVLNSKQFGVGQPTDLKPSYPSSSNRYTLPKKN